MRGERLTHGCRCPRAAAAGRVTFSLLRSEAFAPSGVCASMDSGGQIDKDPRLQWWVAQPPHYPFGERASDKHPTAVAALVFSNQSPHLMEVRLSRARRGVFWGCVAGGSLVS